ncbi:MAG: hypothetical protein ACREB6_13865 [Rhodospirillales bacterium]
MIDTVMKFLESPPEDAGPIYNERSLQLELGCYYRGEKFKVQFERPFHVERPNGSTKRPKTYLDLFVAGENANIAIELKVPLNQRQPETLYDYCADLEFVEALIRSGACKFGACLLVTDDPTFWRDSGRGSDIHNFFRRKGEVLTGMVGKPTGARDSCVILTGAYSPATLWRDLNSSSLMKNGRYLLIEARP